MTRHVDLLGLLYIVSGLLAALVAVSILSLAVGAGALAQSGDVDLTVTARVTAITFVGVALMIVLWGGANAAAGRALRRREPWARRLGLVLGLFNLFVLPFGTALGAYTFWVLLNNESRQMFQIQKDR